MEKPVEKTANSGKRRKEKNKSRDKLRLFCGSSQNRNKNGEEKTGEKTGKEEKDVKFIFRRMKTKWKRKEIILR